MNEQKDATTPETDEDIVVTLELDDGSEVECEIITIFDFKEKSYIVLIPITEEDEDEDSESEIFIYSYAEDEEGNPVLTNIEDDDEYEQVTEHFDELLDEEEFEDMDR
ncbi:MAG: DUF1292 domain-containing protein [Lachnospiraceae bacterium]